MKKAELSLNVIIVAVISLVVLIIVIVIFTNNMAATNDPITKTNKDATVAASEATWCLGAMYQCEYNNAKSCSEAGGAEELKYDKVTQKWLDCGNKQRARAVMAVTGKQRCCKN